MTGHAAAQVVTPTGPDGVEIRDVDEPTPGPDDVLVEVHRIGISFPDLLLSKGQYQLPMLETGVIAPPMGASYAFDDFARALTHLAAAG